jgi:Raf kinase inhibitor-like YbhB/YbcL family protein
MRMKPILSLTALLLLSAGAAAPAAAQGFKLPPLLLETTAFEDGGIVPPKYVGREGVQPGFKISNAPDGTVAYAVIFHDLDVAIGGPDDVLHWIAWNIPATPAGIPEGKLPEGSVVGKNITGQNAYMGPGAPPGPRYHHYVFEVYALSAKLDLPATASRPELLVALKGKTIAKAAYVGRFKGTATPGAAPAGGPPPAAK